MGKFYDSVPVSAIVRIRDMMYTVKDPFRLDQGDVSFDAPETFKQAVAKAMTENRTHYLPTVGIPLDAGIPDVPVDLQAMLDQVYDRTRYTEVFDYADLPDPPLTAEQQAWADGVLRAAGRIS